jgi:hypothetical protein
MADVASLDFSGRLGEVFQRTLPKLEPSARDQLAAIIEPTSRRSIAISRRRWRRPSLSSERSALRKYSRASAFPSRTDMFTS